MIVKRRLELKKNKRPLLQKWMRRMKMNWIKLKKKLRKYAEFIETKGHKDIF